MTGSEFARLFANKGPGAWEGAAVEAAVRGDLTPWPWVELPLEMVDPTSGRKHTAVLKVRSDVVSVGPVGDHLRLPLTPSRAQDVLNVSGGLLPTPWIVYQMWRASTAKMQPLSIGDVVRGAQNAGASMSQYVAHSKAIDAQLAAQGIGEGQLRSGIKKHVVVSNIWLPKKVVIQGWYRPSPPAADVFDDRRPLGTPGRQPIQPNSNAHGDFYVDYSHGIHEVHPESVVDGVRMPTVSLYQHPTLWRLVSHEGPVRVPRYPSSIPPYEPAAPPPVASTPPVPPDAAVDEVPRVPRGERGVMLVAVTPSAADRGIDVASRIFRRS